MNREKLASLLRYEQDLKNKLSDPTPDKHSGHAVAYQAYLKNELRLVQATIEKLKLEVK